MGEFILNIWNNIVAIYQGIVNSHAFHYIAHSNIVNFILLFGLLIFLWYKLDVSKKYGKVVDNVRFQIHSSDIQKKQSIANLNIAKRSYQMTENDIKKIFNNAKGTIKKTKIALEGDLEIIDAKLAESSNRAVERFKDRLSQSARAEIVNSAIQKAEEKLLKMLEENPNMHIEIISSAINEIDGINI